MPKAYWHLSSNFGDRLTPWLIEKISGEKPEYVEPPCKEPFHIVTGSLFNYISEEIVCPNTKLQGAIVWGTGMAFAGMPHHLACNFRAVRGPRTAKYVGAKNVPFGDPGLLLPRLHNIPVAASENEDYLIIYSWVDDAESSDLRCRYRGLSRRDTVEEYIDFLVAHSHTVSSTLHGLVTSIAYGIPTRWVKFSDKMMGDDTKFYDFFESIGYYDEKPVEVRGGDIEYLPRKYEVPPRMLDDLWEACPFRK